MKKNNKKKPLIRALEPRILFDGAAITTAIEVLDNTSFNTTDSTDSTKINDATTPEPTVSTESIPVESGDVFIITTDIPNYEATAQNFAANFRVLVLDQNSDNLKNQIIDATKDLDSNLNVHIITANQNRDRLLVGSYDSVGDLVGGLTSDSKLYDLNDLSQQNFTQSASNQVVIIDESISYSQDLLNTIPADWKIITIDSKTDGLTQILEKLEGISNLSAIHIFSHANSGEIILGNLTLDSNTLNTRADDLKALGTHLNQSGDILLYGCDVSSGFIGLDFVNEFALLTGADIAASDDKTGSYISNADFNLETTTGNIETQTITYDTNGTVLGYINNYTFDINKNGPRLNYQASGEPFSGWWNGTDNNWVDYYTSNQEVSYFGIKWITVNALFFSFSFPIPWVNYYSYGTGVRYGVQDFTVSYDSKFQLTASANNATQNQLGGDRTQNVIAQNYALYKVVNGVGFDKYNPLKNLVTASEGIWGGALYYGDLEAGNYQVVASFDTWRWWPDIISLMTLNQYAEQFFEPVTLRVEDLNRVPVWGSIANQTINGDGNKDIIATTWSNVSDADGNPITVEAVLWNGSIESALPSWLTFNPNTLSFSGNPPANTGTLNIRLKAFDGHGPLEVGYKDFQLTFTNDNDRPIVANEIKDTTWDGQGNFTYQIPTDTFTDADPDADTFTYTAKLADGSSLPSWLSISSSGLISGNPPADYPTLTIVVTVNDGSGQSNATQTDTFILNLKNNNDIQTVSDRIITIDEDTTHIFSLADFVYVDLDTKSHADTSSGTGKTIQSIRIVELPKNGVLWLDSDSDGVLDSGETVQTNQIILASSISKLKYTPNANWAGHGVLTPLDALITGPDSFKWVSSDAYDESSNIGTTTLNVRLVNDSPILSFSAGKTLNIRPNGGTALSAVYVDEGLNLIDPDATYSNDMLFDTIFGISVTIIDSTTNKFVTGDNLSLTGNTSGFAISYDSVNGILTIEKAGGARAAEYQTLLRTLQFSSTDTTNNNLRTLGLSFRTQDVGSKTSAYFDGVDDYIETMNASIPTSGNFTVSVWAKLDNPSSLTANNYSIFGQGDSGSHVYLAIQKFSNDTYHLRIGDDWTITNISSLLSDGKWHQYTITKTGNSSSDGSVFIDGKYIASGNIRDYIASGYGLRIGKLYDRAFNSGDDWTGYWKGSISDLRIYNKALGALDIQKSLSNNLVGNESGLNAWYKLVSDYKNYASVSSDGGNAVVFKQADYGYSIKTGHYYKVDTTYRDYSNATSNAQNSTFALENGYLLRLDDSLSASEMEVVKMLETLKAPDSYWYWIGAERYNGNGAWYWTAGPDSDVYFNHGSNEGLDNNPAYWNTAYGPTGWWGAFAGTWQYSPWVTTNGAQTQVTFTAYTWDSWDWETLRTNLNGMTLFDINTVHDGAWNGNNSYSNSVNINGYNISYTITPTGFGGLGRNGYWDKSFDITINIPANFASSVQLSFGAYLNQDAWDESAEIVNYKVITANPDYQQDKAFMTGSGYIENYLPSHQTWSIIEYGNKGEVLSAPSLFATTNTALPDKYVNETRSITVRQTNNAPTLVPTGTVTLSEDGEIKFQASNFISNFSDVDGDTLSKVVITSVPDASKAQFLLNGVALENGASIPTGDLDKLVLKPLADFNGIFTFKYKASDGYLLSNESTVTVTINAINDAPVVTSNQTLTAINEDISNTDNIGQTITSLISDGTITDVDGSAVEAIAITSINNSYGTWQYKLASGSWANISNITGAKINLGSSALLLDSDSLVRFIPNANFNGTSTFEFRAWDKSSGTIGGTTDPLALGGNNSVSSEVKTATITINSVNDTPTTQNKTISIDEDVSYIFTTNDFKFTDVDTTDILTSVKIATLPTLGTIKLNGNAITAETVITKQNIIDGNLTYISALNGNGTSYSSFTFSVNDGTTDSATSIITFDVNDTNDAPTAIDWASGGSVAEDKISTSSSSTIVGKLNATDPNTGDTLRFTQLSNNKFVINPDGTVKLAISPKDLSGNNVSLLDYELRPTETIRVKVIDSQGLTYETDMTVTVTDVIENTPNLYTNVLYATKGSVTTITEANLRTEDADTSDANLIYTVKQAINGGKLFIDNNSNGTYDEGTDSLLGPESSDTPEYEANFTHADVVAGKIKFLKDSTQINAKISIEVSDGNTSDEGLVVVIVSNPPVLSAAIDDQEWGLSGVQSFTIPASTFTDADFDILTYSAKLSDGSDLPTWLSFNSTTGKFSGTPTGLNDGDTLSITVTATDGRTTPASDTFIITFKATITKPVIANPLPEYIEFSGSGVKTYTIPENTFTNPLTGALSYTVTLGDGSSLPSWLSFNTTTRTFSGNPPASAVSEPLILKITADNGTTTSTTIKLYISDPNDIPVNSATISDKTISDANSHTYTINKSTFSDGDNDAITLILATQDGSEVPSWIKFSTDEITGDLIITAKAPAGSGFQNLRVIGSDGNGGDAVSDFKITYSGGTNESPQVKTSAGISYMQGGVLVTSPNGALEKFSILAGKTSTITTTYLDENDADDDGIGLIYTIVNEPLYGQLWIDSDGNGLISGSETTLSAGDTFTQKDIDDRKLKYKHTAPNSLDDKFIFNLKDGGENSSVEVKNVTFNIDVLTNPTSLSMVSVTRLTPTDTLTNENEVKFKVKFSGVAFAVDTSDFEVTGSGNTGATVSTVTNLGSSEYMITVSGITSNNGDLGIALKSTTDIITTGGSSIDKTFVPTINETFTLDNTAPTVTITADQTIYAGTTPFNATLTFSEKIGGLNLSDITASNATISNLVQVDDTHFRVTVTPTGDTNNITLDFAGAMVTDIAGNNNTSSAQVTITRNIIPTISNINTTPTFTEIDGVDTSVNDVLFTLDTTTSLGDSDSTQDLQSLRISIPTASIQDGAKEELIVNGTVISLNFTNGKAISNITINSVEYKITALVDGTNNSLTFEKASGKMSLAQAEALLDVIKYNNSSDIPTVANRVFSLVVNDGLENSATSTVTVSVVATNDTPTINVGSTDSASKDLTESNTTLNASGTLSVVDLDIAQTVNVSTVSILKSGDTTGLSSNDTALLAMLNLDSGDVVNNTSTTGTINWVFNSGSEYFDYLAVGEVLTLTYTIKATDSASLDSSNQTVVIKITGTNDKPNITASTTTALDNSSSPVTASGALSFSDVDATDTPTASFNKATDTSYTAIRMDNTTTFNLNSGAITALKDALILNNNGSWTYSLDTTLLKDNSNSLIALGDKVSVVYTITIADENNASITKDLKFSFIGTGTGASLVVNGDAGSIVEGSKLSDAGSLTFDGQPIITTATINSTENITASSVTLTTAQKTAIKNAFTINVVDNATTDGVNWTYNINETNLDFLPANEIVTAVFIVDIYDNQATPVKIGSQNVTIVINGTNDIPVITSTVADARGSVTEAGNNVIGTATASDTLTSSDVDNGASKTWSLNTLTGTYGNITINNSTGAWTYTLDETLSATKALQTGDKKTETFVATVSDGIDSAQQTIIVEVNGTNDAPTLTIPTAITYVDTANDDTFTTPSGTLSASDDDSGDTKVFNITDQSADTTQTGFTHSKVGTYGTLYLNALSGAYKYIPNDAKIEALIADTSETFDFTVTDSLGISDTETLTISITATNDTPTVTVDSNNSDTDSLYETNTTLETQGTLTVTDLDLTNVVSSVVVSSMTIDGVSSTDASALAWLTINTDSILSNTETTDTLTWTFNSGSEYFNSLSQGQTKTLVYTIRVNDGTVDTDKTVTITILGTNDAPTITVETGDTVSATLTETNATLNASDTITINEIEPNDTISASIESVSVNSSSTVSSLALPTNASLKAMLTLDKASLLTDASALNELLTWTFNSGSEYFDKIASGETLVLDYVVKISDSANPSKIDTQIIKITINGTNDAPVIDAYASNDTNINGQIESGKPLKLADTGTITFSDIDFSDRPTATETLKTITALRRDGTTTFTLTDTQRTNIINAFSISGDTNNTQNGSINWEYAISQANIDFLGAGESIIALFTITVKDFTTGLTDTQDITITLAGENKTPTLTEGIKAISESNIAIVDTISVTAEDANMSDSLTVSVESGTYKFNGESPRTMSDTEKGWLILNTTTYLNSVVEGSSTTSNTFNWDFNTNGTTFNELNTGETVKLVYTIKVIDNAPIQYWSTKTVTVTITGTNDTPVAVVDVSNTTENSPITIDVLANDTDIDTQDFSSNFTLNSVSITTNNHSTGYDVSKVTTPATVTVVDNKLVFTPNDEFDYLAQNDTATVTVTYTMSDDEGLTSTNTATITITGTNDAPTISVESVDKSHDDFIENISSITTTGTLSLNDKDTLNTVNASVDSVIISGNSQVGSLTNAYFKSMLSLASANILDNAHNDGTITWNFNSGSDIFDYVAKNEELILTYSIKALDISGGFDTQEVVIKITGTNDAPVLNAITSKTYTDTNLNDTFNSYTGTLVSSDTDLTDDKTYSITNQIIDVSETGFTHSKLGNYGKLYLNENTGAYKYIPNDAKIEELVTNETDEFIFNVTDDSGDVYNIDTKTFTINLIGVNDTPVISVEIGNSENKTLTETNGILNVSGTLNVVDLDTTQTVSVSKVNVITSGITTGLISDNQALFDMLSINRENVIDNSSVTGTISWSFNSGSEAFNYLANGETLTLTYTIKATDNDSSNAFDTQTVIITITGTNDTPNITVVDGNSASSQLSETNTTLISSGTLSVIDLDRTDIITTSHIVASMQKDANGNVMGTDSNEPINSALKDMLTITATPIDGTHQTGTISWSFNSGSEVFNYLASGETLTLTYTIKATDDDSSNAFDTQTVVITITGTNDTPTVLNENIDEKTPFGKEYLKETAYLFSDLDRTDIFTFEASNLPLGLSMNPNTGEITGRAVQSGIFIITLKATDSGTPALNVSRTFSLLVIAPAQNDSPQTIQTNNGNEVAQQIIKEITVDRIIDTINSFTNSTTMDIADNKNSSEVLLDSQNNNSVGKIALADKLDITRTELTSIVQSSSNNPNDKIITANANLNLDNTGKVNFDNKSNGAFETVGLTIEKIDFVQEQIEIKVLDTRVGQKYVVTLIDGSDLPDTLSFDPNTGKIIGVLPDGVNELNISIKALSNDGTTRILNLKIDLKELKQKQTAFNSLSEQIQTQDFKMTNYGDFISSLFNKTVSV